jgi:hypothetical protein
LEDKVMSRDPVTARDSDREAAVQQELDAVWLDLACALSTPDEAHWPPREPTLPPAMALALVVDCAPVSPTRPVDAGQLVYERHDSSMLFSATMFQGLAMSGLRPAATPATPTTTAIPTIIVGDDDVSETFVPIAVAAPASRYDVWMWCSLTLTTATLLLFLVFAVDLLVQGR